ncbi:hypothetical protein HDU79_004237 [Rhizoclosmatium sp. JEL0117]|nr:hypothetical protein HDU79_004237 [Rhizoclosmatium sp. JEL0117]
MRTTATTVAVGNKIPVCLATMAILVVFSLLNTSLFWDSAEPSQKRLGINQITPINSVCFASVDSRYSLSDFGIAEFSDLRQITNYITRELEKPLANQTLNQYWTLSLLINKHYALKHGYKIFASTGEEYVQKRAAVGQRITWDRVYQLTDLMSNHPATNCTWFAYLDSDVYLWMKRHTQSLDDYFSTTRVAPESYNYKERELQRNETGKYEPWHMQNESFIVGRNGQDSPRLGYPGVFMGRSDDYICAGLFFVKNNDIGKRLIKDWMFGAPDFTDEERQIHKKAGQELFSYEQLVLNNGIFQRYFNASSVYSFKEFHYKFEGGFRHVWSDSNGDRVPMMAAALKELELWPAE